MTMVPVPICYGCAYLHTGPGMTCDAYPSGIPRSIQESRVDHRQPHVGDHGIVFKKDPEAPEVDFTMYGFKA